MNRNYLYAIVVCGGLSMLLPTGSSADELSQQKQQDEYLLQKQQVGRLRSVLADMTKDSGDYSGYAERMYTLSKCHHMDMKAAHVESGVFIDCPSAQGAMNNQLPSTYDLVWTLRIDERFLGEHKFSIKPVNGTDTLVDTSQSPSKGVNISVVKEAITMAVQQMTFEKKMQDMLDRFVQEHQTTTRPQTAWAAPSWPSPPTVEQPSRNFKR